MSAPRAAEEAEIVELLGRLGALRTAIGTVIVGQHAVVDDLLTGFLAGGHCLLEGVPGLAKTLLIRTLADAVTLTFRRIQFTPDLMPSDVIGTEILEEDHGTGRRVFKFTKGPVFANILLADEINRTPPKTQAALLEAMQEQSVTYAGTTYPLPAPFFVLATQNPIEQAGTYPLPEAQLDRFLLKLRVGYPDEREEMAILSRTTGRGQARPEPVLDAAQVLRLQQLVRDVPINDSLLLWTARLVRATRPGPGAPAVVTESVRWGAGPRAGQALVLSAKARALLAGRFAVTLDDLKAVAPAVLRHRILLSFRAENDGIDADRVTAQLLHDLPAPAAPIG
ncbi:MAG: MoxR family ATPase [Gemmatimonadales bacterium]